MSERIRLALVTAIEGLSPFREQKQSGHNPMSLKVLEDKRQNRSLRELQTLLSVPLQVPLPLGLFPSLLVLCSCEA